MCLLYLLDGARHEGRVQRVGADFLELLTSGGEPVLVSQAHLAVVRSEQ